MTAEQFKLDHRSHAQRVYGYIKLAVLGEHSITEMPLSKQELALLNELPKEYSPEQIVEAVGQRLGVNSPTG